MKRVTTSMIVILLAIAFPGSAAHGPTDGAHAAHPQAAAPPTPAYLRTDLVLCAANTVPCPQPLFGPETSLARARAAWVQVAIYAGPPTPGNPNRPLDQTPHTLRLVVARSLYRTDAPLSLEHWWSGTVRGRFSWALPSLATLPTRRGQPNYFRVLVSVDGWPTTAQQTIAIPL